MVEKIFDDNHRKIVKIAQKQKIKLEKHGNLKGQLLELPCFFAQKDIQNNNYLTIPKIVRGGQKVSLTNVIITSKLY